MLRNLKLTLTTVALVVFCFSAAHADTVTVTGDTFQARAGNTSDGRFTRPNETGVGLSTFTNVSFDSRAFTVSQTGTYSFVLTSLEPAFYDPFLILYQNAFNSATPLVNFVRANDDLAIGNLTQSGFTLTLSAGVNYFAVVTGFSNVDEGFFNLTVSGPGTISFGGAPTTPVPEPATMILLGTGLAGIAAKVRRRKES